MMIEGWSTKRERAYVDAVRILNDAGLPVGACVTRSDPEGIVITLAMPQSTIDRYKPLSDK